MKKQYGVHLITRFFGAVHADTHLLHVGRNDGGELVVSKDGKIIRVKAHNLSRSDI